LSEPKISPDDERLYIIQSGDGGVAGWNQIDAELLWLVSCDQFEKGCSNAVRAEFILSRDGQFLYYGDVDGRVIALKLGEFGAPTPVIILDPTTESEWPLAQEKEKKQVEIGSTLRGSIALIVIATMMIAVGLAILILNPIDKLENAPPIYEVEVGENDFQIPPYASRDVETPRGSGREYLVRSVRYPRPSDAPVPSEDDDLHLFAVQLD
jgi:hypothetical protein